MANKKLTILSIIITITSLTISSAYAKKIYPAEIMARDLFYYGLGWLGHVGIATANMTDPSEMYQDAYQVIEILNEPVVGQINSISNFKSRPPY